jgi:hypothetical protein
VVDDDWLALTRCRGRMVPGSLAARQHEAMRLPGKDRSIRTHLEIAGAEGDDESITLMPAPRAAARRSGRREIASAVCASVMISVRTSPEARTYRPAVERFANSTGVEERHERGSERRGGSSLMKKQTADELSIGEGLSR